MRTTEVGPARPTSACGRRLPPRRVKFPFAPSGALALGAPSALAVLGVLVAVAIDAGPNPAFATLAGAALVLSGIAPIVALGRRSSGALREQLRMAEARDRALLRESEETYKTILMASPDDITIAELSGRIVMVSEAANRIFGYPLGMGPGMSVMDFIAPEDRARAAADTLRMLEAGHPGPHEYQGVRMDGSRFDIEVNNAAVRDRDGRPLRMVIIARDISDRKQAEKRIRELVAQLETERDLARSSALTDSLTGLSNRRLFDISIANEFARHTRVGATLAVVMIDVDYFKRFNDSYGHLAGDDCLKRVACAIRAVASRATDVVARYGGEEFMVILPDTSRHGAATLANRIRDAVLQLAIPHATSEVSEFVTISLGVVAAADHLLVDGDQLVALADQALYQAKRSGRNRCEVLTAPT